MQDREDIPIQCYVMLWSGGDKTSRSDQLMSWGPRQLLLQILALLVLSGVERESPPDQTAAVSWGHGPAGAAKSANPKLVCLI